MPAAFDLISLLYAWLALRALWELAHQWRVLRAGTSTPRTLNLARSLGFYLLTPLGVLAHEAAHLVTAQQLGAQQTELSFRLYWGYVTYWPRLSPTGEFTVAAAGPAASLVLGIAALLLALRVTPLWSAALQSFGMATLGLVLIFYPAMSYWLGFGDFRVIYGTTPTLSLLAASVHALGLLVFAVAVSRLGRRSRVAEWAAHAAGETEHLLSLREADAERLRILEASWTRFLPGVRQELNELRELRDWITAHNRQVAANQSAADTDAEIRGVIGSSEATPQTVGHAITPSASSPHGAASP